MQAPIPQLLAWQQQNRRASLSCLLVVDVCVLPRPPSLSHASFRGADGE